MRPPQGGGSCSPVRRVVARRQSLLGEHIGTPEPSLRHAPPGLLVLGFAGALGHALAFSGMLQKLIRRVHRGFDSLLLMPRPRLSEYRTNQTEQAASSCR